MTPVLAIDVRREKRGRRVKDGTACVLKWKRAHLHIRLAIHNDAHVRSLESEHNDRLCTDDDNAFSISTVWPEPWSIFVDL